MVLAAAPISIVIITKNEEARIGRCLEAVKAFDDVWVVDSCSTDSTVEVAKRYGAKIVNFKWDGCYPKKKQWCLDTLDLAYDFVFCVDADEIVSEGLIREMAALDLKKAGYFVRGRYVVGGKTLKFGLQNNKLALLDRRKMEFPPVDDLDIPGMGEVEGHYQPVFKAGYEREDIGQIKTPLLHEAYDHTGWRARHERYARWEREMNCRDAWPEDPSPVRQRLKKLFRAMPLRPFVAFIHCYIWKRGFLDGAAGFKFAQTRFHYYRLIRNL